MADIVHFSNKNGKLYSERDDIKFWIFDIPSKKVENEIICKKATPMCKKNCYVNTYGNANIIKNNVENYKLSKGENFIKVICNYINTEIIPYIENENKSAYIRIHASGDFYEDAYFENWTRIAEVYRGNPLIQFVAYTKAFDILKNYEEKIKIKPNIRIILSLMPDTLETYIHKDGSYNSEKTRMLIEDLTDFYRAKQYIVYPKLLIEKYRDSVDFNQQCFIEDDNVNCGVCTKCYLNDKSIKIIALFRDFNLLSYLKELEKTDQELATTMYNKFIKEEYVKIDEDYFQMYKRLQKIYMSNSDIEAEKKVLKTAITVFKKVFEENNDSEKIVKSKKYINYFQNRYNKLQNLK